MNMFIFITPHIIKNPADIAGVTLEKEDRLGVALPQVKEELHREVNLEHSVILADRGYEKLRKGEVVSAKEFFIKALQINPNNPYALINLGVAYEQEGNYPQAIQMYERVIETDTDLAASPPQGYSGENLSLVEIARQNIEHVKQKQRNQ